MIRYAHRLFSLLVLLMTVSGTAQASHVCAQWQDEQPAHTEHHAPEPTDEKGSPADCEMFASCTPTAMPRFALHELVVTSFIISDVVAADLPYLPPVLNQETPPPRA